MAQLTAAARAGLESSDTMLIALVVCKDGQLDAVIRVESNQAKTQAEFFEQFVDPHETKEHAGQRYVVLRDRGYFVTSPTASTTESKRQLRISGSPEFLPELIESGGDPPPLGRDIEALAAHGDADRAVTIIVAPKFLQASGAELLGDAAAPLRDALLQLMGTEATAISLSAHWNGNFFIELRATPALNVPPRRLSAILRERINAAPDDVEEFVLSSPWHPFGRKVISRLPGMLRALARYTRSGEDDRQALLRCHLPRTAGHNLVMASELILTQPRAG
jgi:hypothetical protein